MRSIQSACFCPHNNFVNGIPAQASEAPRISTETAETVNVSAEGENAKNEPIKHISEVLKEAEQNYQCVKSETLHTVREADGKWHTYFMGDEIGVDLAYDQINHIPAARTARAAEEVAEICRYINRLNGNHLADADYYLAEMREGIKQAEAARRKKNADTEGEKEAERAEMPQIFNCEWQTVEHFKAIPNIAKLAKGGIIINGVGYHTEYLDQSHNVLARVDNLPWDMERHDFPYQGSGVFGKTELFENWEDAVIATIDALTDYLHTEGIQPPQSPETPQAAKHPTPPPILGRRRRKRARRGTQAAPGLRSAPGMRAGGCGVSRHVGRRAASVTSLRGSVGISGMVHGGSFHRGALPRAGPPSLLSAGEGVKVA